MEIDCKSIGFLSTLVQIQLCPPFCKKKALGEKFKKPSAFVKEGKKPCLRGS
jgi:hypothetical protein